MKNDIPLIDLPMGVEVEIVELRGGRGFQSRLRSLGLVEGQQVKKLSRAGLGGPVIVLINRTQVAIGCGMASRIIVRSSGGDQRG
jgi:ferrous iron transport protein A